MADKIAVLSWRHLRRARGFPEFRFRRGCVLAGLREGGVNAHLDHIQKSRRDAIKSHWFR